MGPSYSFKPLPSFTLTRSSGGWSACIRQHYFFVGTSDLRAFSSPFRPGGPTPRPIEECAPSSSRESQSHGGLNNQIVTSPHRCTRTPFRIAFNHRVTWKHPDNWGGLAGAVGGVGPDTSSFVIRDASWLIYVCLFLRVTGACCPNFVILWEWRAAQQFFHAHEAHVNPTND